MTDDTIPLLDVISVEVTYAQAILAVRDVSFTLACGEILALLGPNGAGKTTTLKAVSNLLGAERGRVTRGVVRFRGEPVDAVEPARLVASGVAQVLEGRHCFAQLTVEENLLTGAFAAGGSRALVAQSLERVYAYFPRLRDKRRMRAGYASGGEQQMTAIGRALMARPTLVVLDEPSMGQAQSRGGPELPDRRAECLGRSALCSPRLHLGEWADRSGGTCRGTWQPP